jgi:hypothetical protein
MYSVSDRPSPNKVVASRRFPLIIKRGCQHGRLEFGIIIHIKVCWPHSLDAMMCKFMRTYAVNCIFSTFQ